jgi:3-deoxy-D-manno-octulosonate 8-phosphate phosphatase (KDO 8-P phosphatase)
MQKLSHIKLLLLDVDGTMTDAGVYITEDGKQFKKFNARDGIGIQLAMKAGIQVGIISHSIATGMVEARANMLKLKYYYVGQDSKLEVMEKWRDELKLDYSEIAYMGDDVNDLDIMKKVGTAICPADALPKIKAISHIQLSLKGGEGCVREFIDGYLLD